MGDRIAGFLNKKPWHPSSFRNQEKTWLAEQRAEKEEAALRERIAEIKKEKEEEESRSGGGWVAAADNPVRKPASSNAPKRSGAADLLARARPAGASTDKDARRTKAAAQQKDALKRADEKRKAENAEKRRRKKAKKRRLGCGFSATGQRQPFTTRANRRRAPAGSSSRRPTDKKYSRFCRTLGLSW